MKSLVYWERYGVGLVMNPHTFRTCVCAAVVLASAMAAPLSSAEGCGRYYGDFWSYDIEAVIEGVTVYGSQDFDCVGREPSVDYDTEEDVEVFRITGSFSGVSTASGVNTTVTGVYDGWSYTIQAKNHLVMEDLTTYVNVTQSVGTFAITTLMELHETVRYLPPLMSGLDAIQVAPEVSWNETIDVYRTSLLDNGTALSTDGSEGEEEYRFSIVSVNEPVETPSGEFTCYLANMTWESGYELMWHCPEAGRPVMVERYDMGSSDSVFKAVLAEHAYDEDGTSSSTLVLLGVAASAAVLVAVAALVVKRSRTVADGVMGHHDDAGGGDIDDILENDDTDG